MCARSSQIILHECTAVLRKKKQQQNLKKEYSHTQTQIQGTHYNVTQ